MAKSKVVHLGKIEDVVDSLGVLLAQKSDLDKRVKAAKDYLSEFAPGAYEGALFRATVSESERSLLDMAAVREKLSPQFIAAHTSVVTSVTVKVVARNGLKVAA